MLQEVDKNSSRTYGKDEAYALGINNSTYALNYSCKFVPYPVPPIGRVNSGLLTTTVYDIDSAERISLPCPFKLAGQHRKSQALPARELSAYIRNEQQARYRKSPPGGL